MFKKTGFKFILSLLLLGAGSSSVVQAWSWSSITDVFTQNVGSWLSGMDRVVKENPYMGMLGVGALAVVGGLFGYWKYKTTVKKLTAREAAEKKDKEQALTRAATEEQDKNDALAREEAEKQAKKQALASAAAEKQAKKKALAREEAEKQAKKKALARAATEEQAKKQALARERQLKEQSEKDKVSLVEHYQGKLLVLSQKNIQLQDEAYQVKKEGTQKISALEMQLAQEQEFSQRLVQEQLEKVKEDDKRLGDLDANIDKPLPAFTIGRQDIIGSHLIEQFIVRARNAGILVDRKTMGSDKPTIDQVYTWIKQGGAYAYHLFFGGDVASIPTNTEDAYLDSIISLTWYFFAHAIIKGEAFTQGSFMIIDPHNKLQNFLMGYAQTVNTQTLDTPVGSLSLPWDSNGYAYKRVSSHLKASVKSGEEFHHYGIDVRFKGEEKNDGTRGWAKPWLPSQKRHILFGKVKMPANENSMVFFKIEDYGLFKTDGYPQHAGEFGISLGRKIAPAIFGSDDAKDNRKERIEGKVKTAVKELVAQDGSPLTKKEQLQVIADVSTHGVQCFYTYVKDWSSQEVIDEKHQQWLNDVRVYLDKLDHMYDHINVRYGREVILAPHDMFDAIYYELLAQSKNVTELKKIIDASILGYQIWSLLKAKQKSVYGSIMNVLLLNNYKTIDEFVTYIKASIGNLSNDSDHNVLKKRIMDLDSKLSQKDITSEIQNLKQFNESCEKEADDFTLMSSLSSSYLAPSFGDVEHE